jgi:hypothetical protein
LLAGDLSGLTKAQHEALRRLARSKPIVDLATAMNVDPFRIAVALLAETTQNRVAQRLGRRLLKDTPGLLSLLQGHRQVSTHVRLHPKTAFLRFPPVHKGRS